MRAKWWTAALGGLVALTLPGIAADATPTGIQADSYLTENPTLPTDVAPKNPRTLLLGDSTMSALWWTTGGEVGLAPLDYHLDAESCRTISVPSCTGRTNPDTGQRYRAPNALTALSSYADGSFDELVLMVGYNEGSATFRSSVPQLLELARAKGVKHVTWLTFHVEGTYQPPRGEDASYRSNNELLTSYAKSSNGYLTLLDWDAFGKDHPGTITADGAHLTGAGAVRLGYLITDAVFDLWGVDASTAGLVRDQRAPTASRFDLFDTPRRVLDTRVGLGMTRARQLKARQSMRVGTLSLPEEATGAIINVTAIDPAATGYLTVYPCSAEPPLASTLNVVKRQTRAVFTFGSLDADGGLCVFSAVTTDIAIDVLGWSGPSATGSLAPTSPRRLYDSRSARAPLRPGVVRRVDLPRPTASDHGVSLNVTAVDPASSGYLTVYPTSPDGQCGKPPVASTLNFGSGANVPNRADVPLVGTAPGVCLTSPVPTDVIVDLQGRYTDAGGQWMATSPTRVLDSRTTGGRRSQFSVPVGDGAAVALTVTAVGATAATFVTVYEADGAGGCGRAPLASTLNLDDDNARANSTTVTVHRGVVCAFASAPIHLIVDVVGRAT